MYIGTHYNGYYNSLFGDRGSIYSSFSKTKTNNYFNTINNSSYNSTSLKYVQDLKSGSGNLSSALSALTSGSAYKQKTAVSSDSGAMTVKAANSIFMGNKTTAVKINQVATGQVNTGKALATNGKSAATGYQQFSIESNGRTYQFSINVGAGDSNKEMQQKMAAAINMRSVGINASVVTDSATGASTLQLEAQNTGDNEKSKFTIKDVHGSAVEQTGADQVSQEAQNAVYSVNGGAERTSQSNTVDLGNGITATLLKASDKEITVTQATNTGYAIDKVQDLVSSYNQLYGAALNNTSDSKANNLFNQLVNASRTYTSSLSKIGIGFDSNGYMQVNEDKMTKAVEDGSLEKFFSGSANYGYTSQLSKIARNVSNNTSFYVSQSTLSSDLLNSNYNFYNNSFFNTYQNYFNTNNTLNSGLLFDLLL